MGFLRKVQLSLGSAVSTDSTQSSGRVASRIVMGTAQLGLNYGGGVSLATPTVERAYELLDAARALGIKEFDTAASYGPAEEFLGRWLDSRGAGSNEVTITTKFPVGTPVEEDAIRRAAARSAAALRIEPRTILFHDAAALLAHAEDLALIHRWIADEIGPVRVGVSVYDPDEALASLEQHAGVIQAPVSVLDRRCLMAGVPAATTHAGAYLQARSIQLRGVLADRRIASSAPKGLQPALARWFAACEAHGLLPADAALRYAAHAIPDATLVLGFDNPEQIDAAVRALASGPLPATLSHDIDSWKSPPRAAIDPREWDAGA